MLSDLVFRLRSLFRRNTVEAELDDELRFHFEQQVEKYVRLGLTREEAGRRARLVVAVQQIHDLAQVGGATGEDHRNDRDARRRQMRLAFDVDRGVGERAPGNQNLGTVALHPVPYPARNDT